MNTIFQVLIKEHSVQTKQGEKWCPSVMCGLSMVRMLLCLRSVKVTCHLFLILLLSMSCSAATDTTCKCSLLVDTTLSFVKAYHRGVGRCREVGGLGGRRCVTPVPSRGVRGHAPLKF